MKLLQLSRSDRVLLGILLPLALLGALVTYLIMPPKKEGGFFRQPSSFFNDGAGTKMAYLVLERLGYQVRQLRRPISTAVLDEFDALMILEPVVSFEKDERKAIGDWIEAGHTLVVAPGVRFLSGVRMPGTWFFDNWFSVGPPAERVEEAGGKIVARPGESLNANDPLTTGIREMVGRAEFRFASGSPLKGPLVGSPIDAIWIDDYGIVAMRVHYGEGRVIALADTHWVSNRGLLESDNGLFLANLAREITSGGGEVTIGFDEYHHGFALTDDPWIAIAKLMLAEHWGWGVVQAGLAAVLALYAAGVRFGRPRDIVPQQRRQHGEFAEAAGRTLHDAHAADLAYRTLYHHYRARLCQLVHLAPDATRPLLSSAVAAQCGLSIDGLLGEAESRAQLGGASRVELLDMTTQFHRVLEVLEHAT